MRRLWLLLWLLLIWWFPWRLEAATLTIESTTATGAIEITDGEGRSGSLLAIDASSVVAGPWVFTEIDVAYREPDAPGTLRIVLPPHAIPLDRAFVPKLEQKEGNLWERKLDEYATRVQIAYVQEITQPRVVLVPLAEREVLDHVTVQVTDPSGQPLVEPLEVAGGRIKGDVVLSITPTESPVRAQGLTAIPVRVPGKVEAEPLADTLFLVDTSASSHESYARLIDLVRTLMARSRGQIALLAFDQEVESVYRGAASAAGSSAIERLVQRGSAGATDLAGALRSVSPLLRSRAFRRVVLISDGLSTLDRGDSRKLKELVGAWSKLGVRRLDAVVLRPEHSASLLRELTTTELPERGVVVAATDSFDDLPRLEIKTTADRTVTVGGATAQSPRILRGFEPGDLVWIYARVPANLPLVVQIAGVPHSVAASEDAYYPLLERVFPHRGIEVQPTPNREELPEQLEIRDGRLEAVQVRSRPPRCRCGGLRISGRLPPEVIQRVVRLNHGRFRGCYQKALLAKPRLSGRVAVRFVIGPVGHVMSVSDEGSTLDSPATIRCVLESFSKLEFPIPEGGDVTVVYPLRLTPGGAVEDGESTAAATLPPVKRVELLDPQFPLRPRDVGEEAYLGGFADVMKALRERRWRDTETALLAFERQVTPDLISVLARAQYAERRGELTVARRTYGSLLDLYPRSAPMRRLVATHWARLGDAAANSLLRSGLEGTKPAEAECDMSQRQLAWSWVNEGNYRRALELLVRALQRCSRTPEDPLPGLLREDIAMIARAALTSTPARQSEVFELLRAVGVRPATETPLRFLVVAEQGKGLSLGLYPEPSRGRVRGVDQWFGPHHAFTIAEKDRLAPYIVHVRNLSNVYARHSTSFGYVEIVDQDARGALRIEHRPFVFQTSRSEVDLGLYGGR
jgi:hypothetical protein